MPALARRNLMHDKMRLAATLAGVGFAVVLVAVQMGLFLGFSRATTDLISHSGADLWITSKGVPYLEQGTPFSERKLYTIRAMPGVKHAEAYVANFSMWKRSDGRTESVIVVGFDLDSGLGGPWNIVRGRVGDLRVPDTVFVDEGYFQKLGITGMGGEVEIFGRRARVGGITRGIRTFTTMPYVFTSLKNAKTYANIRDDQTAFVLVKAQPDTSPAVLQQRLRARLSDVDVHTAEEFTRMTRNYWLFTTGAGMAVLAAAALGLLVGGVVVTQTLYSTTMDHLREFGTLKAIGASNGFVYKVIVQQALMSAGLGYALGMALVLFLVRASAGTGVNIQMPWPLATGTLILTVGMCVTAAVVSIRKVMQLDPALVFRQ